MTGNDRNNHPGSGNIFVWKIEGKVAKSLMMTIPYSSTYYLCSKLRIFMDSHWRGKMEGWSEFSYELERYLKERNEDKKPKKIKGEKERFFRACIQQMGGE